MGDILGEGTKPVPQSVDSIVRLVHASQRFQKIVQSEPELQGLRGGALYQTAGDVIQRQLSGMEDPTSEGYRGLIELYGQVLLVAANTPHIPDTTPSAVPESYMYTGRTRPLPEEPYF